MTATRPHCAPSRSETLSVLNLRRLLLLRAIAIAGWAAALLVARFHLHVALNYVPAAVIIAVWLVFTLVTWVRLTERREVGNGQFFLQLLIDISMLAVLLYFTGGSTNPFTLLFLLPLTVAAAMLPGILTWAVAVITAVCYTVLLFTFVPMSLTDHLQGDRFGVHVLGMWSGFVLSAGLIASFVVKIGASLRERDRVLAEAKERALRDERIIALGTLAAGAAHELGTPLGTIAVLIREIERDYAEGLPDLHDKIGILREQVGRCKSTLSELSSAAGQSRADAGHGLPLDRYLAHVVSQWQAMRPGVELAADLQGTLPAPAVIAERTLSQALITILNNAADASPEDVAIAARWDSAQLTLEVCDRGAGVAPAVKAAAGKVVITTKAPEEGLGLGLYLAYSVVSRLHGQVQLLNREGGGACTRVVLPLAALLVHAGASDGERNGRPEREQLAAGR